MMNLKKTYLTICLIFVCAVPIGSVIAQTPQFWGEGVKSCREFVQVVEGRNAGKEADIAQYLSYRSWLSGFVSGLSAATDSDVLQGVPLNSAMRRIHLHCVEETSRDFANASMQLVRILNENPTQ